jgi:diguanylate cyclase (GGDEF)-like protein/PAS domain S-box-containing protein
LVVTQAMMAWSAAWALIAALACARLLRVPGQPERSVKNGYRWLAVAAICLAAGATVQQAFGGLAGGASPLRLADLISLAALPALVIGLATLTANTAGDPGARGHGPRGAWASMGMAVDSCMVVGALFVVLLVTLFGPDYAGGEIGRAAFALALVRPIADLIALGLILRFFVRNSRLTLLPVLALVAVTVADSLAVADRTAGRVAGLGSQLAVAAALALLALTPTRMPALDARAGTPVTRFVRSGHGGRSWSSPATVTALAATAAAAIVVTGFAIGGGPLLAAPLALAGSVVVLLLVARLASLTRQASAVAEAAQESDWMFGALAGSTSDAVLISDVAGTVVYASRAVAEFGYVPEDLIGMRLADVVHPEDRPAGIRAAIAALHDTGGTGTFAGRVRGADGSWRHVESTLSRYVAAGEPVRLLITSRDVSDQVALRRQLTQLTFHDGLTGLPNRAYVEERVKGQTNRSDPEPDGLGRPADGDRREPAGPILVAAILVDFDGYAAVNEIAGHAGGDLVLAQAGRRLRAAVPPAATVARWGSDEFAVLLGSDTTDQEVIELAERLAGVIAAEPFTVAARQIALTASVGAAMSTADQAGQVLGNAGTALAKAQEAGPGRVEFFAPDMNAAAERRIELAADLSLAIAERRLEVEYLPVIDLRNSQIRAVTAAPRWTRDGEVVPDAEFGAVAEESGLIVPLGEWMLRRACRQVAAWRAAGMAIGLSVRCTARQASGRGFVGTVLAALEEAELPPELLTLEISERMLTDSPPPVAAELAGLRGKGIRLALAAFGTGLISLASLRQCAVDVIRIDPSCIAGLDSDPTLEVLTKTIIQLGHDLGMEVIADGIERPEQRWRLESMGCLLGQGPGVAVPIAEAEFESTPAGQAEDAPCKTASLLGQVNVEDPLRSRACGKALELRSSAAMASALR